MRKNKISGNSDIVMAGTSGSRKVFNVVNSIALAVFAIISVLPIWYIVAMSFSSSAAVEGGLVGLWPVGFTLESYQFILGNNAFYSAFWVSIQRVLLGVPINLLCSLLLAYPLSQAKENFSGRKFYVAFLILTMLFSGGMIPTFMVVRFTGLMNSIWSLVLPTAVSVFNTMILLNFFRGIPKEMGESALVDGAGHFTILFRIYLPLAKPAIATLLLFFFVTHWNTWFDGLMYLNNSADYPLQTYLQGILVKPDLNTMTSEQLQMWTSMSARATNAAQIVVTMLPIMVVYPFLQRYYTKGLTLGGVKG